MEKCFCCEKVLPERADAATNVDNWLLPVSVQGISRVCRKCASKIRHPQIDPKRTHGSDRFPSVYGKINSRWSQWERTALGRERLKMAVTVKLPGGECILTPMTKSQRVELRGRLNLRKSQTL